MKEYTLAEINSENISSKSFYVRHFKSIEDVELDWPHSHLFFSFVWFTQGSGIYVIDSEEYEIKPQRVFYVAPKQIHNWSFYDKSQGYFIAIDLSAELDMSINFAFPFIDIDEKDVLLHSNIIKNILDELWKNDELSNDNIKTGIQYFAQLLNRIAKTKNIKTCNRNILIEQFKQLILSDYSKLYTNDYYANKLGVQIDRLNNVCKTTLGISAKQYILNLKITEAKRLLIYSEQNMNEISERIGIEDSSYFARIFKKKTGLTPSDFSRKYRKQL
jgi:AraC family transcriptional regulator, transcriptional activator of pobA